MERQDGSNSPLRQQIVAFNTDHFRTVLSRIGIYRGSILYLTGSTAFLPPNVDLNEVLQAFLDGVGEQGTMLMPTFTFDFCDHGRFDVDRTGTYCGRLSQAFLKLPGVRRTWWPPIHTVAVTGHHAKEILALHPNTCFGAGSAFDWMANQDTLICLFGVSVLDGVAHLHWLEEQYQVSYRTPKSFIGVIRKDGIEFKAKCTRLVRVGDVELSAQMETELFEEIGPIQTASIGAVRVHAFHLADYIKFMRRFFDVERDFMLVHN